MIKAKDKPSSSMIWGKQLAAGMTKNADENLFRFEIPSLKERMRAEKKLIIW